MTAKNLSNDLTDTKIKDLKGEDPPPIREALKNIYHLIGLPADAVPEGTSKKVLHGFIMENYGELAAKELVTAFEMAIQGETEVKIDHFNKMSASYFGKILKPYLKWRQYQATRHYNEKFFKYKSIEDFLEKELYIPYQKLRQGEEVDFAYYHEYWLFNYLHNHAVFVVENPKLWLGKAEELQRKGKGIRYVLCEFGVQYKARRLYFRNWIQKQALNEVNLRELLSEKIS